MATLLDLAAYLNNTGSAADGGHAAIDNWCACHCPPDVLF